jgi:N6-adenosine-specific RNA methylase IME4
MTVSDTSLINLGRLKFGNGPSTARDDAACFVLGYDRATVNALLAAFYLYGISTATVTHYAMTEEEKEAFAERRKAETAVPVLEQIKAARNRVAAAMASQADMPKQAEPDAPDFAEPVKALRNRNKEFPSLPANKYEIIYADPAWDYKGQHQHGSDNNETGGASDHYPTATLDHLKTLSVASIAAADCLLFMWTSSPHMDQAVELGQAWGFSFVTVGFVWHKQKPNPGNYTMSECELCLVFKRGRIPEPRGERNIRQFLSEVRGKHSEKPAEIRNRIAQMFPTQSKIELFSRHNVEGWDSWGTREQQSEPDTPYFEALRNPPDTALQRAIEGKGTGTGTSTTTGSDTTTTTATGSAASATDGRDVEG